MTDSHIRYNADAAKSLLDESHFDDLSPKAQSQLTRFLESRGT